MRGHAGGFCSENVRLNGANRQKPNWNYEYNAIIYFNKFPMRYTAIAATCFGVVAAVAVVLPFLFVDFFSIFRMGRVTLFV